MDLPQVSLDPATGQKLMAPNAPTVELRDEAGHVVGYFVPPERMAKIEDERKALYDWLSSQFPPEMIARAKNDPRPKRSMDDVLRLFEGE